MEIMEIKVNKEMEEMLIKILYAHGVKNQLVKTTEELSELSVETAKFVLRKDMGERACPATFIEEIADVYVMLWQLVHHFKIEDNVGRISRRKLRKLCLEMDNARKT